MIDSFNRQTVLTRCSVKLMNAVGCIALVTVVILFGCAGTEQDSPSPQAESDVGDASVESPRPQIGSDSGNEPSPIERIDDGWGGGWVLGNSVKGRPVIAEQYGVGGPVLFLMGGIHGNERSAVTWGERTRTRLLGGLAERNGLRIIFMGAANPDGIARGTRSNARNIDLNRNFATKNFAMGAGNGGDTALSEPESTIVQQVFDTVAPSGVIAVHCCVPTMDHDGPSLELATAMAQAMPETLRYPTERLGSKPGSFGSYVGIDHDTPIITLEFASHDYLDLFEQLDAIDMAIEAAAAWTAENPGPGMSDSIEALAVEKASFSTTLAGPSAGGLPIRFETREGAGSEAVVLLSGLGATSEDSMLVAEHIRRVILSDALEAPLTVVTGTNPDGLTTHRETNQGGTDILRDFVGERDSIESQILNQILQDSDSDLVIWVRAGPADGVYSDGMLDDLIVPSELARLPSPGNAIVTTFRAYTARFLVIDVGSRRGRVDLGSDDVFPDTDPRPFSAMVRRLLVDEDPCLENDYCDVLCPEDRDCECPCDYNAACEAAMKNSSETCLCDANCFHGRRACEADQHCDTWCPTGIDPDCR